MRFLLVILLSCFSLVGFCSTSINTLLSIDSEEKSSEEKVIERIWLAVDNPAKVPTNIQFQDFGGLYLNHPLDKLDEYLLSPLAAGKLIVQLDERMNPVPGGLENLPSLLTLASISDQQLFTNYLDFLRSAARGYGIRYVVLPSFSDSLYSDKNLLKKIAAFDSHFFLNKESLHFGNVSKKKDFIAIFDDADFWVINPLEANDVNKMIGKHSRHIANIEQLKSDPYFTNHYQPKLEKARIAQKMSSDIFRSSIIPMQKRKGMLPLKSDTICLVTDYTNGDMANMLRKYAYVITARNGIVHSKAPIIIDNNWINLADYSSKNRQVIFLGDINIGMKYNGRLDAALFTSVTNTNSPALLTQILLGLANANGTFPYNSIYYRDYNNDPLRKRDVLAYSSGTSLGLGQDARSKINAIVREAVLTGSTPGCQIAVAKGGSIILDEGYGFLTYDSLLATDKNTLYDLASVTKVTSTLLAVMKLYEDQLIDLDAPLENYLQAYANSNKAKITLRQILSHNAGLLSYVPFWERTIGGDRVETFYYKTAEDERLDRRSYGIEVTPLLIDSLRSWIVQSPISKDTNPKYRYSDIGFMILHQVVESITNEPIEQFVNRNFYEPLGLQRLCFNPIEKGFDRYEIAPTEYDHYFRNEQVWGQVHDRNAAIFGGVAGHAGLFSNAHDLLILMQMIAQGGSYDGKQFLSPSTLDYFNNQYFDGNRRALGWDKLNSTIQNASKNASPSSFGHTGFTGTVVWVDPQYELVFIFLSNRVYPDANNNKLIQKDIRTRVQDVVYDAILSNAMN
jgi:CubicO group peptidase (beta-lactamase class C family)